MSPKSKQAAPKAPQLGGQATGPISTRQARAVRLRGSAVVKDKDEAGKKTKSPSSDDQQRLRIRVRAHDHKILDASVRQIVDTAIRHGVEIVGPVPLPTEIRKYTVNRSSFVHKNAREQFEMRVHKRLVDMVNPTPKIIDALTNLNLPAGVDIEVKM